MVSSMRKLWCWKLGVVRFGFGCRDDSLAQFAMQNYMQLKHESYRLYDDVRTVFASLKKAHIPLALITNGSSESQHDKLRRLRIEDCFDAIVISGEIGVAKPDIYVFEVALTKLGVEPEYVWHVGDDLNTDVAGANAASLTAVWLNRNRCPRKATHPKPDFEILTLRDLWNNIEQYKFGK